MRNVIIVEKATVPQLLWRKQATLTDFIDFDSGIEYYQTGVVKFLIHRQTPSANDWTSFLCKGSDCNSERVFKIGEYLSRYELHTVYILY